MMAFTLWPLSSCAKRPVPTCIIPPHSPHISVSSQEKKPSDDVFVGMPVSEAQALAKQHGIRNRVIMIDGKPQRGTKDYRPDRLNFTVNKGVVTKVTRG